MRWNNRGLRPAVVTDVLAAVRLMVAAGDRGIMATAIGGPAAGDAALLDATTLVVAGVDLPGDVLAAAAEVFDSGTPQLVEAPQGAWFVEPVLPAPRLIVLGAIAAADALVPMAAAAGYAVHVIDTRDWLATEVRFPAAASVRCGTPHDMLLEVGIDSATSIVSFLHEPRLEDAVLLEALRSPAGYVGAMGSRKTTAAKRARLAEAGLDDDLLRQLRAPIGLPIGSQTPQEIAVSVLAEVVAVGRGRGDGGRRP